jgi:hypothetical protein
MNAYSNSILENKLKLLNDTLDKVIDERNTLRDALSIIVLTATTPETYSSAKLNNAIHLGKLALQKTL